MYRGQQNFGGGDRYNRDERRYDDFYRGSGGASGGGASRGGRSAGGASRDWDNTRDRGFFNRDSAAAPRRDDRGHAAGMMAALQAQQTQTMLAALSQANNLSRSGLLPTPGNRYQDRDRRGGRGGGGERRGGGPRPGDKRRGEPANTNYNNKRDRKPAPKSAEKPKPKPKVEKKKRRREGC